MKVIIFGVSGNSGLYMLKDLLSKGHEVVGVSRSKLKEEVDGNYIHVEGDIREKELYSKLPIDVDLVINFAGIQPSIISTSEKTDLEKTLNSYVDVNINGVFNILEFVRKNNIKTYIYTTTHRDYENHWDNSTILENNMPTAINYSGDHTMYAITKTSAMMMGDYYGEAFGIRVFNLRLPMMFMVPEEPYYLVNGEERVMPYLQIIKDAIEGKSLQIWGDPEMKRDYVHIENLIQLINLCNDSDLKKGTFNVGTGEGVTTESFIKNIGKVFGKDELEYIYKIEKKTYKCAVYNIEEQKSILGYQPILLNEMLEKIKQEIMERELFEKWDWI